MREYSGREYVNVSIDFGQATRGETTLLLDGNNTFMTFNSNIDVFNFMYEYGYKLSCNYDGLKVFDDIRYFILERISE